jgi:hypothetical protein
MLATLPLSGRAHHPLDEVYERGGSIALIGTVTRVDWSNPHVVLSLGIDDGRGAIVNWLVELDPPHILIRRGWTENSIVAGQIITVEGFPGLDGNPRVAARSVSLSSGESLEATTEASWSWTRI